MTREEQKHQENVHLIRTALKKIGLAYEWDTYLWTGFIFAGKHNELNVAHCDDNGNILFGGIDDVETLGKVAQFYVDRLGQTIINPFFGIKDSIGLKIALDLMG